jgi:CubicO group peptidase (beta-lactamase class C family)
MRLISIIWMNKGIAIVSIVLILASNSFAQENTKIENAGIDKIINEFKDSLNIPGIAVGIALNDSIKYTNAIGYSNLETKTALTLNSVWHICSVSKQFSAVACLKLAQGNKLSLNDKISKYFDNIPNEYSEITISNLLSHTSGIKDYINEKKLYGLNWEKVIKDVFSDSLNFKPGTAWKYSNTGFWMIAKIIEKVSGMEYYQFLKNTFFNELNLGQTQKLTGNKVINQRVNGYLFESGKFQNPERNINEFYGQGDGDLMSTLNDLLIWNIALVQSKILNKESTYILWNPTKLNNGKWSETFPNSGIYYGLGWFIKNVDENTIVWTPGAGFGYSISSQFIPKYNLTIIVLCNKDQFLMADEIGFSIARNILKQCH